MLAALPYRVHTVLTDNGTQFGDMQYQPYAGRNLFGRVCNEHRFTKPAHPLTNGQMERMIRPFNEATVLCYHYETKEQLNEHLQAFLLA